MTFERVCALDEVPGDRALAVTLGRFDLAIARDGDEIFAVEDLCSHAEVALSEGEVATNDGGCQIECFGIAAASGTDQHSIACERRARG